MNAIRPLPRGMPVELTPPGASRRIDSMLRSRATRCLLLGTALAAMLGAEPAAADLWRWIDADGVPRYTPDPDRVPSAQRSTLVRVEPGMAPTPQRESTVVQPPAIFAPPGDPALAADPWNEPERARVVEGEVVEGETVVEIPSAEPASLPAPSGPTEPLQPVDAAPVVSTAPLAPPAVAEPAQRPLAPRPAPARAPQAEPVVTPSPSSAPPPSEILGEVVVELPGAEPPMPAPAKAAPPAAPPPSVEAGREVAVAPQAPRGIAAPDAPAPTPSDRTKRRAELLAAIARDEEALKAHVSSTGDGQLAASAELREIAERLPALQAELRALEAQGAAP